MGFFDDDFETGARPVPSMNEHFVLDDDYDELCGGGEVSEFARNVTYGGVSLRDISLGDEW